MKTDIQRKKFAFLKSIRNQHLNQYFTACRQQAQQTQLNEHLVRSKISSLLEQLPSSIQSLSEELNENLKTVTPLLTKEIRPICDKMVGTAVIEWSYFVYLINRLLVATAEKEQIQLIINSSLLPVLEGAEMQLQKARNNIIERQIMSLALEYSYRLGGYVKGLNSLEQLALANVLKRLWDCVWQEQEEQCLVQTCLNIFTSSFDPEDEENVTNEQKLELQFTKITLITAVFYGENNEPRLSRILERMVGLVLGEELNEMLLEIYLRLLISFTKNVEKPSYYYPLLKYNLLHLISAILYTHPSHTIPVIIYTIRLLNNILVNDITLTSQILQEIMLSKVVLIYHQLTHNQEAQQEIAELFINLIHFLNDEPQTVREMVNIGVSEIVLEVLQRDGEGEDQLMKQGASALIVMLDHSPYQIKKTLRQHERMLRKVAQQNLEIGAVLENVLEGCRLSLNLL